MKQKELEFGFFLMVTFIMVSAVARLSYFKIIRLDLSIKKPRNYFRGFFIK
jgi:phosphatidylserine synthase